MSGLPEFLISPAIAWIGNIPSKAHVIRLAACLVLLGDNRNFKRWGLWEILSVGACSPKGLGTLPLSSSVFFFLLPGYHR
jgi:hypothetical protein